MDYSATSDSTQTSATPSSDGSNVPDLMRIGTIPDNTAISVDTDILDPVVINDSFCRFQLQNKGILHSNSKISLSASVTIAKARTNDDWYFPLNCGVHALINRATLKVGTKTLCEVSDYSHFQSYQSMFVSGEHNKEREQYTSSRCMNHEPYLNNPVKDTANPFGAGVDIMAMTTGSNNEAHRKGLSLGKDLDQFNANSEAGFDNPDELDGDMWLQPQQILTNNPVYQVNLSDLFPFLRTSQLPLYMMTEPVTLEISWTAQDSTGNQMRRACCEDGATTTGTKININNTRVQMVADYLYYPQQIMEQYRNQNPSLQFAYVDYQLAKRTVARVSAKNLILNIGGAGRIINKVFTGCSADEDIAPSLLNNYTARSATPEVIIENHDSYNGSLTQNIRYNDHFLYPIDVQNTARHFHNIVQAEGKVPFVTRQEYGAEGLVLGGEFQGHPQSTELTGRFFYTSNRLNRNERINSRGIELYSTYNQLKDTAHTLRIWLEVVRLATLTNGVMSVEYA